MLICRERVDAQLGTNDADNNAKRRKTLASIPSSVLFDDTADIGAFVARLQAKGRPGSITMMQITVCCKVIIAEPRHNTARPIVTGEVVDLTDADETEQDSAGAMDVNVRK